MNWRDDALSVEQDTLAFLGICTSEETEMQAQDYVRCKQQTVSVHS